MDRKLQHVSQKVLLCYIYQKGAKRTTYTIGCSSVIIVRRHRITGLGYNIIVRQGSPLNLLRTVYLDQESLHCRQRPFIVTKQPNHLKKQSTSKLPVPSPALDVT